MRSRWTAFMLFLTFSPTSAAVAAEEQRLAPELQRFAWMVGTWTPDQIAFTTNYPLEVKLDAPIKVTVSQDGARLITTFSLTKKDRNETRQIKGTDVLKWDVDKQRYVMSSVWDGEESTAVMEQYSDDWVWKYRYTLQSLGRSDVNLYERFFSGGNWSLRVAVTNPVWDTSQIENRLEPLGWMVGTWKAEGTGWATYGYWSYQLASDLTVDTKDEGTALRIRYLAQKRYRGGFYHWPARIQETITCDKACNLFHVDVLWEMVAGNKGNLARGKSSYELRQIDDRTWRQVAPDDEKTLIEIRRMNGSMQRNGFAEEPKKPRRPTLFPEVPMMGRTLSLVFQKVDEN